MGSVAVGGGGREERAAEGSSQPGVWGMNTKINSGREQSSGPRRSSNTNHCPSGSNWPTAKSLVIKREKETSAALPASASFPVFLLLTVAREDRRQRLLGAGRPHQILKHGAGQSESSRTGGNTASGGPSLAQLQGERHRHTHWLQVPQTEFGPRGSRRESASAGWATAPSHSFHRHWRGRRESPRRRGLCAQSAWASNCLAVPWVSRGDSVGGQSNTAVRGWTEMQEQLFLGVA